MSPTKSGKSRFLFLSFIALVLSVLIFTPVMAATLVPFFYAGQWGSKAVSPALPGDMNFDTPTAIDESVDGSYIYVADTLNNRVQIYHVTYGQDPTTLVKTYTIDYFKTIGPAIYLSSDPAHPANGINISGPRGVAVDAAGNVYVSDSDNNRVIKFVYDETDQAYYYSNIASAATGASFSSPNGLVVDSVGGYVYVADTNKNRILQLLQSDLSGNTVIASGLSTPKDVALDTTGGILLLTETGINKLAKIQLTPFSMTYSPVTFNQPIGVTVDKNNIIYVADSAANQIQKIALSTFTTNTVLAKWGTSGTGNYQFKNPAGVVALDDFMVFVADTNNHRVIFYEPNVAPVDLSISAIPTVDEGNAINTTIGTLSSKDPNALETGKAYGVPTTLTQYEGQQCDNSAFYIASGNILKTAKVFDYETQNSYNACVTVTDSNNNVYTKIFTVPVGNTEDKPILKTSATAFTNFNEWVSATPFPYNGQPLGTIVFDDNDWNDTLSFQLIDLGDSSYYNYINDVDVTLKSYAYPTTTLNLTIKNTDTARANFDYDRHPGGKIILRITDTDQAPKTPGTPNVIDFPITISPKAVNEPPSIVLQPDPGLHIAENSPANSTPIGYIYMTDPDRPAQNLTLIENAAAGMGNPYFKVGPTVIKDDPINHPEIQKFPILVESGIDYETYKTSTMYLQVYDSQSTGTKISGTLVITIDDVNESPALPSTFNIPEGYKNGDLVKIATDPENDDIIYNISAGNELGTFGFNAKGQLIVLDNTLLDLNNSYWAGKNPPNYTLTLSVKDAVHDYTMPKNVAITIVRANSAPVFDPAPTLSIKENPATNGTVIGQITASDYESNKLTFSTNSDPGNPFTVETTTAAPWQGIVKVKDKTLIDYESDLFGASKTYSLPVTVTDGNTPVTQNFIIHITNQNEAISATAPDDITIGDHIDNGEVISKYGSVFDSIHWTDPDANTTPRFSIAADQQAFTINEVTGLVTVKDNTQLHYYIKHTYPLTITVYDSKDIGSTDPITYATVMFTVNITDDNDAPGFVADNPQTPTLVVQENKPNGTLIGTFTAYDENNNNFSVSLDAGVSGDVFSITPGALTTNPINGVNLTATRVVEVRVANSAKLDYDTAPNHVLPLKINAVDNDNPMATSTYTYDIHLTNVNEAPVLANQTLTIFQKAPGGTVVGNIHTDEQDTGTTLTYEVTGGTGKDIFAVGVNSGQVTVKPGQGYMVGVGDFTLFVKVHDNGIKDPLDPTPLYSDLATIIIHVTPLANPAIQTFTAPPQVITGSELTYHVTVKNLGLGATVAPDGAVPGDYTLQLTLPGEIEFTPAGSTTGCVQVTVSTVECPGAALASGDSKNYDIKAFLYSNAQDGKTLITTTRLNINRYNDSDTTDISNLAAFNLTARKSITITNQTFELSTVDSIYNYTNLATPLGVSSVGTTPSCPSLGISPRKFIGPFTNDRITFMKDVLPHSKVEVSFDLYLLYSWNGSSQSEGPDHWRLCVGNWNCQSPSDSRMLLDTTFSNRPDNMQAYPNSLSSGITNPAFTNAVDRFSLGYSDTGPDCGDQRRDSIYRLTYKFDNADENFLLSFIGENLQTSANEEQWGIDNLSIVISGQNGFQVFIPKISR